MPRENQPPTPPQPQARDPLEGVGLADANDAVGTDPHAQHAEEPVPS